MNYTEKFKKICQYTLMGFGIGLVIGIVIGILSKDFAAVIASTILIGSVAALIISTKSGLPGAIGTMGVNWIMGFFKSMIRGLMGGNIMVSLFILLVKLIIMFIVIIPVGIYLATSYILNFLYCGFMALNEKKSFVKIDEATSVKIDKAVSIAVIVITIILSIIALRAVFSDGSSKKESETVAVNESVKESTSSEKLSGDTDVEVANSTKEHDVNKETDSTKQESSDKAESAENVQPVTAEQAISDPNLVVEQKITVMFYQEDSTHVAIESYWIDELNYQKAPLRRSWYTADHELTGYTVCSVEYEEDGDIEIRENTHHAIMDGVDSIITVDYTKSKRHQIIYEKREYVETGKISEHTYEYDETKDLGSYNDYKAKGADYNRIAMICNDPETRTWIVDSMQREAVMLCFNEDGGYEWHSENVYLDANYHIDQENIVPTEPVCNVDGLEYIITTPITEDQFMETYGALPALDKETMLEISNKNN